MKASKKKREMKEAERGAKMMENVKGERRKIRKEKIIRNIGKIGKKKKLAPATHLH